MLIKEKRVYRQVQIHGKFLIRLWEKEELLGPLCLQIKGIEGRFSDLQVLKCLHSILDFKKKKWTRPLEIIPCMRPGGTPGNSC